MKKQGFTLAEALITIAIIGVVAAMTIPNLIANTRSQQYRSKYKKVVFRSRLGTYRYINYSVCISHIFPLNQKGIRGQDVNLGIILLEHY